MKKQFPINYQLLRSYDADSNLPSRRWGATTLFKTAIAKNPELKKPLVAGMKRIQPNLEARCAKKDRQGATLQKALDSRKATVEEWKSKFGKVSI